MDEYEGFWTDGKGSGIEGWRGNGYGNGYGNGNGFGFGGGNGWGNGNGNGHSNPTKDHREG